jgi:hypothetical protein
LQNSGNLAELPLEGILETVQRDRATGTLHLTTDQGQATLFFLFGHLFHAIDGQREGEPVVYDALGWQDGEFTFDSKAKLPAEETIKVSTAELLAARGGAGVAESNGAAADLADDDAEADDEDAGAEETIVRAPVTAGDDVEEEEDAEPAQAVEVEAEPEPVAETPAEEPAHPQRRATDSRPDIRPPETMQMYPVPLGKLIYESLTAGFVDFPKLLRSLNKDQHSGYVRLSGEGFSAVLLFSNGAVVEAIYDAGGTVATGRDAFTNFGRHIDEGEGVLDVISLTPEMVTGMYQLLTGPSLYEKLLARFVKADALLEYLTELQYSGAVIARSEKRVGIVIIREGEILGVYTDASRDAEVDTVKFLGVCKEPAAEIEVRGGPVPDTLPVMEPGNGPREVPSGSAPGAATAAPPAPAMVAAPAAAEPSDAGGTAEDGVDYPSLVNEMAGRADAVLGTRAKKVKELLYATSHSREELEGTIERISELSIMFVDPSKLTTLADDMRRILSNAG